MVKKYWIAFIVMTIMLSLAGCSSSGSNSNTPTPPQSASGVSQMPAEHPAEVPSQSGDQAKQEEVEGKIKNLLNQNFPGEWKISGTTLSKGSYTENGNYKIVDDIAGLFPDTMGVSIFVGEERISSSVVQSDGQRVLTGYPTPATVGQVMKGGSTTSTVSSGYFKLYLPLKAGDSTVGVLTVSVPQ